MRVRDAHGLWTRSAVHFLQQLYPACPAVQLLQNRSGQLSCCRCTAESCCRKSEVRRVRKHPLVSQPLIHRAPPPDSYTHAHAARHGRSHRRHTALTALLTHPAPALPHTEPRCLVIAAPGPPDRRTSLLPQSRDLQHQCSRSKRSSTSPRTTSRKEHSNHPLTVPPLAAPSSTTCWLGVVTQARSILIRLSMCALIRSFRARTRRCRGHVGWGRG